MKAIVTVSSAIAVIVATIGVMSAAVSAQSATVPSGDQVASIRSNCSSIKTTLSNVHASDGLARVNYGRLYEQLSTKLMAPFNSRLVSNRLDGSSLVSVTSGYEQHVEEFRSVYQRYDVSVAGVLRISCTDQPTRFYEELLKSQKLRADVRQAVEAIENDIESYQESFDNFRSDYSEGVSNDR